MTPERDSQGRLRLDWMVDTDARAILSTCTAVDADVVWAAGALTLRHAWAFASIPPDPRHFAPILAGSQLGNRRWYGAGREGWQVYRYVDVGDRRLPEQIVAGGWPGVARLVTARRVGRALAAEIADVLAARAAGGLDRAGVERRCTDVAARVWDRLRPDWALIDRFDLAGTA